MSLFYFYGEFEEEQVVPLLENLNKTAGDGIIYFTTNGGNPSVAYVLADSLWRLTKNGRHFKIIFYESVHSAAFLFLTYLQKIKEELKQTNLREAGDMISWYFLDTAYGILHSVTHVTDKEDADIFEKETQLIEKINNHFVNIHAKKLTKQEKLMFKKGQDVVFDAEKLQRLFGGTIIKTLYEKT